MKVSVLVPVYNVNNYITRCAKTLFEQSYEDIEYIFVDDCSQDESISLMWKMAGEYPQRKTNIRIVKHDQNRGVSAARNTGVQHCSGDFILQVDPDDYLELNAVEKLVNRQLETGADIVNGQVIRLFQGMSVMMERPQFKSHDEFVEDMIKPSIHHTLWGRLVRRSLYTDNHIQAKEGVNIGEDMQIMSQLAYYAQKVESIWEVVYYYDCTNEKSCMNQYSPVNPFRLSQDIASMEVVRDFFAGKSEKFQNIAERYLYDYYWTLLEVLGKDISKKEFNNIKSKLLQLKPLNCKKSTKRKIKITNYSVFVTMKRLTKILLK